VSWQDILVREHLMTFTDGCNKVRLLQFMVVIVVVVWTGILFGLYHWASHAERDHLSKLASLRAESVANHTQALRGWIGGHGGVYVEMTAGEELSYLAGSLPESEVATPSGRKLRLLSSSAVLGKISKEFKSGSGDHVRLTSKQPMNPGNVPDEWERQALDALEGGAKKVEAVVDSEGGGMFRLMYPMVLQDRCLRCHDYLAAAPTRIVGGLSVTVDKAPYDRQYDTVLRQLSLGYTGIWLVGIVGIGSFGTFGSRMLRRIEYASTHDGLTGLKNRLEIERHLAAECQRSERYRNQLAVMMLDMDHFKRVNDSHGHQVGDETLRVVAETIRTTMRRTDIAGRFGGEEFLVLATETSPEGALTLAQRFQAAIKGAAVPLPGGDTLSLTVSIGVCSVSPERRTPADLIQGADEALYRAKESGRDRIVVLEPPPAG
jgi:diguanylate cyclase (GGDEF)-like protein